MADCLVANLPFHYAVLNDDQEGVGKGQRRFLKIDGVFREITSRLCGVSSKLHLQ